ncbi:MAG: hypothetical protein FVQ82_16715 [Planctomycetes bacterium]|nr:hypothetical protein [Planctomycetota bacterium]
MSNFSGRSVAVSVLKKFDAGKGDVGDLLGEVIARCAERGKATDIVYGVVRNRDLIDRLLGQFGDVSKDRVKGELLNVLRVGVYEIVFCPGIEIYAAVNEAVSLGPSNKQRGFVNAVLRNVCRGIEDRCTQAWEDSSKIVPLSINSGCLFKEAVLPAPADGQAAFLSAAFSLPKWLVGQWIEDHGYEPAKEICMGSNRRAGVYLMPNTLKVTAEQLAEKLGEGFEVACDGKMVRSPGGDVASFAGFDEGLFHVQDPTAARAVDELELKGGETVVDLCSAPGGKTVRMAQIMGDEGLIIAADADSVRLEKVRENCSRLGTGCVKIVKMGELGGAVEGLEIDAVLADVPCSNTGVMARRCEVRHRIRESICDELFEVQISILEKAASLVRKGGKICYSTCSIMESENSGVIDAFLNKHPDFEFVTSATTIPKGGYDGEDDYDGGFVGVVRKVRKV